MPCLCHFPRSANGPARKIFLGIFGVLLGACSGSMHISPNSQLIRLSIKPKNSVLSVGESAQLSVAGTYGDGTTNDQTAQVQWASSDASIALVSSTGVLHAKAVGAASISASIQGLTASIDIKVNSAAPNLIAITPNPVALTVGQSVQLTVTATLTDGTFEDVTRRVTWTISDPSIIAIDSSGLVTALKAGKSGFSASVSGTGVITETNTAMVAPEVLNVLDISAEHPSMPVGTSQQLSVLGNYSDGTVKDLTAAAVWSSTPTSIVSIAVGGQATALALGTTTVSAVVDGIEAVLKVNVSEPVLSSIVIAPSSPRILAGKSVQFRAIGTLSDGSTSDLAHSATWTVENPRLLEIDPGGNAIGLVAGVTTINATVNGLAAESNVVVRPVALASYFSGVSSKTDATVRTVGITGNDPEACTMVFVFGQDQQMAECCGCQISREGIRTLSLRHDLLANPLTAVTPDTGTVVLVPAESKGSACDPAGFSPAGSGSAWSTHLQISGAILSAMETPFTQTELGDTLLSSLQVQCGYIQSLGGGHGVCTCGTGN